MDGHPEWTLEGNAGGIGCIAVPPRRVRWHTDGRAEGQSSDRVAADDRDEGGIVSFRRPYRVVPRFESKSRRLVEAEPDPEAVLSEDEEPAGCLGAGGCSQLGGRDRKCVRG